jgi:dephospho-CoA kinase
VLILDSALLIETGLYKICHLTALVFVPEPLQLERLVKRDNMTEEQAKARIASQMKSEEKFR